MDFSKKLYFLISKNKLTQEEFAKKVNTRQQVVSRWLSGIKPSSKSIAKIAEALSTTPEELLSEKESVNQIDSMKKEIKFLRKEVELLKKQIIKNKKK